MKDPDQEEDLEECKRLKVSFESLNEIDAMRGVVEIARNTLGLVK
jgi:hypothetical protein